MSINKEELLQLSISKKHLENLQSKRIFFGHQSVGNNIIDGIKKLMSYNTELNLKIQHIRSPSDFLEPCFGHVPVGTNKDSKSKCDSFRDMMDSGIGKFVDFAFFKFCFVDIDQDTRLHEIFNYYTNTMDYVRCTYPHVTCVHITTPLTATPGSIQIKIKSFVKKVIKKKDWVYAGNIQRNKYNTMIREKYLQKEPIYDLATIESTKLNGEREAFMYNGETYNSLVELYTDDGAHLNDTGQIQAAKNLIDLLCHL